MTEWILVFSIHSTFWLGLASVSLRVFPRLHPGTREAIWYTGILASLSTPSVQLLGSGHVLSLWSLPFPDALLTSSGSVGPTGPATSQGFFGIPDLALGTTFIWGWLLISGALLLRHAARVWRSRSQLARQEIPVTSPATLALANLSARAGLPVRPKFTESENLGSPIAFGFGSRAEICIPARALHELDQESFSAMLGHEVAHHQRRDPLRLGALNVLASIFFFQPLLRFAQRGLYLTAEEQCDDWAAGNAGDRVALAHCLTLVASWVLAKDNLLPGVGMTRGRSQLAKRVNRLMDGGEGQGSTGFRLRRFGSAMILLTAPWLAPEVVSAPKSMAVPAESAFTAEHDEGREDGGRDHGGDQGEHEAGTGEEHDGRTERTGSGEHSEEGRGTDREHRTP